MTRMITSKRAAAKAAGLTKYKSRVCVHGHDSEKWTANGFCVECGRILQRAQKRARDPEERKRANAKYYGKPGAMRKQVERTRSWRQRNPERAYEIGRSYRERMGL
jgi:hypothetical protein